MKSEMQVSPLDCLLINPDSSLAAYQGLSGKFSAIEPPTWALLLAESCRAQNFTVNILDCCAEHLSLEQSVSRIQTANPRVALFVVYGQNPNAGTTSMIGATQLASALKKESPDIHICFVGSHVSALPKEVLELPFIDSILLNEGVYALHNLLHSSLQDDLCHVKGLGWKSNGTHVLNDPEITVPQERLDVDLPGYAWDLLPFDKTPLDLYRSHVWHGDFNENIRTPYAAIYTSLGCIYGCEFCMINILNRTDNSDGVNSADSRVMRFWSVDWVLRQLQILNDLGVTTVRISDEMFLLNHRYYVPICEGIIERGLNLHMWAYSRVDTVREPLLELISKAGIKWLALGIEAGSQTVRKEISKGSFKDINVRDIVSMIRSYDINVIANYIVGFPDDDYTTMTSTLNLALELNTEMINIYPCQALPGSPLYTRAIHEGWDLPTQYDEFAFLSYNTKPLPTKHLSNSQVLAFRDYFWKAYFTNPSYLELVEKKFGKSQRQNVEEMSSHSLNRSLLER
jgi:radical SAM superfamily enzyme YgiQ (UPF0313 family)